MKKRQLTLLVTSILVVMVLATGLLINTAGNDKGLLQGVWVAQTMETDGIPAPADAVAQMRFTFRGDTLVIKGNFSNDREDECAYKIDQNQSPKHMDITPPKQNEPIVGIYDVTAGQLRVCLRQDDARSGGRPTEFATKPGSKRILIVLKKQTP